MSRIFTLSLFSLLLVAQTQSLFSDSISVQSGLSQPLIGGWNIAGTYYGEKFLFGYSHGSNLNFDARNGAALTPDEKAQKLKINLPYTTGFSFGYLFTPNLDLRLEFKEHFYRVQSENGLDDLFLSQSIGLRTDVPLLGNEAEVWLPRQNPNKDFVEATVEKAIASELIYGAKYITPGSTHRYRTRSVGLGLYYRYFPMGGKEGLMLEPSIRFWPNVWADSPEKVAFESQFGLLGIHKAHDQGLFFNVSLGYMKSF
ncbi:hypothetical protein LPTSP4_27820 [Leptospira ryugenii]|uniref:Outer membrane protein beta-barrel domain-containing protein n=1 Tax=Leptospira ryugenii TaxID=1917863 RepID=A0A2P2E302_9LEPT|nr:hypothetical protein [Leptospira ryugenii]GBF51250.1 hypothetical protein LPTSP4_27820 [Leptospira ryugenii]